MFRELDMVVLKKDLPRHGLNRGALGSIVLAHLKNVGYDVEFIAPKGNVITVVSLKSSDIRAANL